MHNFPQIFVNLDTFRCYFCGAKFILPQELSRHIRDKTCKSDDNDKCPDDDTCHETGSLSTLSLLELPIITDMSTSVNVNGLDQDNYMIIEHATELNLNQSDSSKNEASTSGEGDHSVLWGCKQCDFRYVQ